MLYAPAGRPSWAFASRHLVSLDVCVCPASGRSQLPPCTPAGGCKQHTTTQTGSGPAGLWGPWILGYCVLVATARVAACGARRAHCACVVLVRVCRSAAQLLRAWRCVAAYWCCRLRCVSARPVIARRVASCAWAVLNNHVKPHTRAKTAYRPLFPSALISPGVCFSKIQPLHNRQAQSPQQQATFHL